jgi:integrase
LNKQQVAALLDAVQGHRLELLYHLAIRLGIRKGELLGLRRSDVNFDMRTIKIAQQVTNVGSKTIVTTPKTARSKRTLPIPDDLIPSLRQHLDRLVIEAAHNHDWQEHGLLFPSENGTPIQPRNLIRHFKIALEHAKLPNIRFHDLRHTAASLMDLDGVPTSVVQSLLGHSDATMTRHYSGHADMEAMRRAVER